jgi:LemA protein
MIGLIILIGVLIGVVVFTILTYNKLIKLKNKVNNSWAHIEAQLQRRFDLIPNLVEIIKGYTEHEKHILENVSNIRNEYLNARSNEEKISMDIKLTSLLKSLYVISENYPNLKSNIQFLKLQEALTEIEEDISYARQFYNDAVTIYNNQLMCFPNNIIASSFGFKEEKPFNAVKEVLKAPRISFKDMHHCPNCGATITHNSTNCDYCGCYFN